MHSNLCSPLGNDRRLAIFGAGGSAREVAWLAQQCWGDDVQLCFVIDEAAPPEGSCNGIPVMQLREFAERYPGAPVVIAIGDSILREACAQKCAGAGLRFASLVHPRAEVSPWVKIGDGSIVCAGSIVTTNVALGQHVHVNVACSISHDANIGDFCTLSPGVHLAGWVTLGRRVFLGTGAIVKNGAPGRPLVIGDDAIVGASACVIADVGRNAKVAGVPARPL